MLEISDDFANGGESASKHELEANGSEASSSKTCTEEVYPAVKSFCECIFSNRIRRNLAHEQILREIENSKKVYCDEEAEVPNITQQLNDILHVQEKVRRMGRHVAQRAVDLEKIKEHAERKIMLEKDKSDVLNEDTKNLCSWYTSRQSNIERCRREKEEFAKQLDIQKEAKIKTVESALQRRKDASKERDRIRNQRRDDMQKIMVDKNSRRDDLRQKFDQFVSSNQRGQELRMYQEQLKKVQHETVQRSTEIQAAKLKEKGDFESLSNSLQNLETTIIHADKEADCKDEIQKIEEACSSITEERDELVEILEGARVEEETLVEVKCLRMEESLKGNCVKNVLVHKLKSLQNSLKQREFERDHLITRRNEIKQREEDLLMEIANSKEKNKMIAEEVDIFESLIQYTVEKTDENAKALTEKEAELEGILCNHTSQKIELKKMRKLKDEQREQIIVKKHRLTQIERSVLELQGSIESMEKKERKKRIHYEESEKSRSQLRDAIKALENDRKQLNAELTNLFTEASDCQDELRKLKESKMDFEQVSPSHAEHIRTMQVEAEDLRSKVAAAEQENKKLLEKFEESGRLFKALSDKVSNVMTPQRDALLKDSDETVVLEASFIDKKLMLSQIETSEQERKLRLAENKTKLDDLMSRLKQQLNILDEEQRKNAEKVEVLDQELAKHNESLLVCKEEHQQVLYAYDSAADKFLQVKDKCATVKRNKIKLLNMCDMAEKVARETEVRDHSAIESKRADLDNCKTKYEAMVKRHNECLAKIKRQLAAFDARITEIKGKRMSEKRSISAGLPSWPKPILKSPIIDIVDPTLKKSVSFGDSPDNLQILPSDSSLDTGSKSTTTKRKLLPLLQEKPVIEGKSRRVLSSGKRHGATPQKS